MPTLTPVEHDPFGSPQFGFVPVDHDPWASDPSASDIASMTHQAEGQNPAQPYLDAAKTAATKGLAFATGGLKGAGVDVLPDWMNTVGGVFQNPDNQAILGVQWRMAPVGKYSTDYQAWRNQRSAIGLDAARKRLADPSFEHDPVKLEINRRDRQLVAERNRIATDNEPLKGGSGGPKESYGVREWRGRSNIDAPEPGTVDPEMERALADYMKSQNLLPLQRQALSRDASGRPLQTQPFRMGNEDAVLQAIASKRKLPIAANVNDPRMRHVYERTPQNTPYDNAVIDQQFEDELKRTFGVTSKQLDAEAKLKARFRLEPVDYDPFAAVADYMKSLDH